MNIIRCLIAVIVVFAPVAVSGQAKAFEISKLADGVYAVVRQEPMGLINESNSMLIVGAEDVIVVDAQSSVSRTLETLAALRRITTKPRTTGPLGTGTSEGRVIQRCWA